MDVKTSRQLKSRKSPSQIWLKLFSLLFATYHLPTYAEEDHLKTATESSTPSTEKKEIDNQHNADEQHSSEQKAEEIPNTDVKADTAPPAQEAVAENPEETQTDSAPVDTDVGADGASMPAWTTVLLVGAAIGAIGAGAGMLAGEDGAVTVDSGSPPAPPSGPLILNGTAAADIFEIPSASTLVEINNYEDNKDVIDLTELGVSFNDVTFSSDTIDTTITVTGGYQLSLNGFGDSSLLTASDFRFSVGTTGNDTLYAGSSNADMTGNAGADTFMFLSSNSGVTITDFTLGVDSLDLSNLGLNPIDVFTSTDGIDSTVYILGVAEITLEGMSDPSTLMGDVIL